VKSIIQFALTFEGVSLGPIFGVFILGFFVSFSNGKGAWIGMMTSFSILIWIYTGSALHEKSPKILPLSTDFCSDLLIGNDTIGPTLAINDSSITFLLERYDSKESEEFRRVQIILTVQIFLLLDLLKEKVPSIMKDV
ncbi:Sodium-coupled monocarboxylate transporter 2, partial [Armadillidium nasatum]